MKIRTLMQGIVCLIVPVAMMLAADLSGKWTWEMEGRDGQKRPQALTLKVDGGNVSGTMTSRGGEQPIENAKINGNEISFTRTVNFGGESRKFLYTGKLEGNDLKLNMKMEGGDMTRDFVAKRAQ
jgi:hypothetical protein